MEATYKAFGGRLLVKVTGENVKSLIEQIGSVAEVLDADQICGCCGSEAIYPRVRTAKKYTYYELNCSACGARLSFGQHQEGETLFAKRDDHRDTRGWYKFVGIEAPKHEAPKTAPAPTEAPKVDPPELAAFIERAKSAKTMNELNEVFGELCEKIRAKHGDGVTDSTWNVAVKTQGEPDRNREKIVRFLYREAMK